MGWDGISGSEAEMGSDELNVRAVAREGGRWKRRDGEVEAKTGTYRTPRCKRPRNSKENNLLILEFLTGLKRDGDAAGCGGVVLGGPGDVSRWVDWSASHYREWWQHHRI